MASITRPHFLLHSCAPSLNLKLNSSSSFLRHQKLPNSLPFTRRGSFFSVNSTSHKSESVSIVNDLLDYLNESWTHFHATGSFVAFFQNSRNTPPHSSGINFPFPAQRRQNDNYSPPVFTFLTRTKNGTSNQVDATSSLATCLVWLLSP